MKRPLVMTLFGTRPEAIKVAPVVRAMRAATSPLRSFVACTGQHRDLVDDLLPQLELATDSSLSLMSTDQSPQGFCSRAMCAIDALLDSVEPDLVLVQGDTTSALAGALAAFYRKIPTGHIEAGLRTADPANPFPEEMNRRLITRLASLHFAATAGNRETLLSEGVDPGQIAVTGNPVVDSLHWVRDRIPPGNILREILAERRAENLVLLTAHRRERFGRVLEQQLSDIRRFVDQHRDLELVFPVHPNPNVRNAAERAFSHHPRIRLVPPLGYADFIQLLSESWLALSDSGGIQEEAPSLGVPLLVLRDSTERPEVVESGHAQLLGPDSGKLPDLLESKYQALHAGADGAQSAMPNPFGDGRAAARITAAVVDFLSSR